MERDRGPEEAETVSGIAREYGVPDEIMRFVRDGLLQVLSERSEEKTVEFHIPVAVSTDPKGRITSYSLTWIHPDFNAQFCHYYDQSPGDLPNFYVAEDTSDVGDEQLELEDVPALVEWLEDVRTHVG